MDRVADAGAPTPDSAMVDAPAVDAPPDTAMPDTAPPVDAPPRDTAPVDAPTPDAPVATPDTAPDTTPDTAPDTAIDTALPIDAALPIDTGVDSGLVDAQPALELNGCTMATFEDETDEVDGVFLGWDNDDPDPRCVKVKAGTTVTWAVEGTDTFATHPIAPFPADPTSPIMGKNTADDEPYPVLFPAAGTFGFRCTVHPDEMRGAIWVVP